LFWGLCDLLVVGCWLLVMGGVVLFSGHVLVV
jgi:hypothetical protein